MLGKGYFTFPQKEEESIKKGRELPGRGKPGPKVQNKTDFDEFKDLKEVKNCWSVG